MCPGDTPMDLAKTSRSLPAAESEAREAMGRAAKESFLRFAPEDIFDQWEALFRQAAAKKGNTVLERAVLEQWTSELLGQAMQEIISRPLPLDEASSLPAMTGGIGAAGALATLRVPKWPRFLSCAAGLLWYTSLQRVFENILTPNQRSHNRSFLQRGTHAGK